MNKLNSKIKVGIVDDHILFKAAIKNILSSGCDLQFILDANDGMDLIEKLQETQPDILLLDITMPVMDGLTVLPIIRLRYPAIKVIILSLHDDQTLISTVLKLGACGYILKNEAPEKMLKKITSNTNTF